MNSDLMLVHYFLNFGTFQMYEKLKTLEDVVICVLAIDHKHIKAAGVLSHAMHYGTVFSHYMESLLRTPRGMSTVKISLLRIEKPREAL